MQEDGHPWRLRLRMAEKGMFDTSDLVPLLAERGITAVAVAGLPAGHPDTAAAVAARARGAVRHLRHHPGAADRHPRRERPGPPAAAASGGGKDAVTDLNALRPARARLRPGS